MATKNTTFRKCAMRALVATALVPGAVGAAEDVQTLRAEIEALKKEVRDMRDAAAKPGAAAKPAATDPGQGWSASVGGARLTLYGTLNADAGTVERSGATAGTTALNSMVGAPGLTPTSHPNHGQLRSNSSNWGIRGTRPLFAGLSAVFQIESSIGVDGGASNLAGRDTFLGLSSPYGTLLYGGNIDSPYKRGVQGKDPFFATGVGTQKGVLGSPGFNVTSVNAVSGVTVGGNAAASQQQNAGFDARLNNLVMYRSPVLRGFSGEIGYGMNEQKSNSTAAAQIDPKVWSLLGRYEMGPIFASYSYEVREDVFGLNSLLTLVPGTGVTGAAFVLPAGASSTDTGNKLGLGYTFGRTELLLVWERLQYETNAGALTEYSRDAWVASVNHHIGRSRVAASYSKADAGSCTLASGASCSTSGLGAQQIALGYFYDMDTVTTVYAIWSSIRNEEAAAYNFGVSGAPAAGVGADPQALALGIRYRF